MGGEEWEIGNRHTSKRKITDGMEGKEKEGGDNEDCTIRRCGFFPVNKEDLCRFLSVGSKLAGWYIHSLAAETAPTCLTYTLNRESHC